MDNIKLWYNIYKTQLVDELGKQLDAIKIDTFTIEEIPKLTIIDVLTQDTTTGQSNQVGDHSVSRRLC